ncbi:hypothetical protein V6N11_081296 [Hibiscus sabdariffa]|uniref:Uncharacterized protein n=1 Tax=Hibiscus sabdariffa TaxID=183260 RepID=A0ABR2QJF5_9ROSI
MNCDSSILSPSTSIFQIPICLYVGVGRTGYPVSLPRIGPGPGSHQFLKTGTDPGPDKTRSQIPGIDHGVGRNLYQYRVPGQLIYY